LCTGHARLLGSKTAPGIVAEHQPTEGVFDIPFTVEKSDAH